MAELSRLVQANGNSWSIEKRVVRKDDGVVWVAVNGTVLRDEAGRAVRIMAMVSDITASKVSLPARLEKRTKAGKIKSQILERLP